MTNYILTESSIHYVAALLDRETDRYPSQHHQRAIKEFRTLSNQLLETLEMPIRLSVVRHRLEK